MQRAQGNAALPVNSLVGLFQTWCSHYDQVIPCLETGLKTDAARNPLDNFVKLHFDAAILRTRSADLCQAFQGRSSNLQCMQQNNATLEEWCRVRFSQGMHYVFGLQLQPRQKFDVEVFKTLACHVTSDISGCVGAAMPTCSSDVKRDVLAYYALFTNETCIANPDDEYTTPAPPPARPHDTVIACTRKVSETLQQNETLAEDASPLDQLLHGLKQNCRTFEARYTCYDEELTSVQNPSFRDLWLKLTFDRNNAVKAQKEFCDGFEGGVVGALNADCYNKTQPRLQECEIRYSRDVSGLEREWATRRIDNVGLHQEACASSLRRAFCLRNAFQLCSEALADVMLDSELGTLPNICLTLLQDDETTTTTTTTANRNPALRAGETRGHDTYENDHEVSHLNGGADEQSSEQSVSANEATGTPNTDMQGGSGGGGAQSLMASCVLVSVGVLSWVVV